MICCTCQLGKLAKLAGGEHIQIQAVQLIDNIVQFLFIYLL
jgi:hypothetical protein